MGSNQRNYNFWLIMRNHILVHLKIKELEFFLKGTERHRQEYSLKAGLIAVESMLLCTVSHLHG